jgi:hypothetical protein
LGLPAGQLQVLLLLLLLLLAMGLPLMMRLLWVVMLVLALLGTQHAAAAAAEMAAASDTTGGAGAGAHERCLVVLAHPRPSLALLAAANLVCELQGTHHAAEAAVKVYSLMVLLLGVQVGSVGQGRAAAAAPDAPAAANAG